jgi:hypothetical protein
MILTKSQKREQKRALRTADAQSKKVRFAAKLIQSHPAKKISPISSRSGNISFGSFKVNLMDLEAEHQDAFKASAVSQKAGLFPKTCLKHSDSSQLNSDSSESSVYSEDLENLVQGGARKPDDSRVTFSKSTKQILNSSDDHLLVPHEINSRRHPRLCSWCFSLNHTASRCASEIRCVSCFNYGHKARWCITRKQPRVAWRQKFPIHTDKGPQEIEGSRELNAILTGKDGGGEKPRGESGSSPPSLAREPQIDSNP